MRLFTDRDVGTSLGRALRLVGVDVVLYADRYESQLVADDRWLAEVTAEGLVILTKDTHIASRPGERQVFEAVGARAFVLATRRATKLENLRAVLIAWPQIEREVEARSAPFMFGIDRTGRTTQYVPYPAARGSHSPSASSKV